MFSQSVATSDWFGQNEQIKDSRSQDKSKEKKGDQVVGRLKLQAHLLPEEVNGDIQVFFQNHSKLGILKKGSEGKMEKG